jgi:hypothetical protein
MARVSLLKVFDNSQRMQIVVEPLSMPLQAAIQRALTGVPKRRVPDVMNQCEGLSEISIEPQRRRHLPGHLRDLDRMRQPAAKMIRRAACKYLRLSGQPAECSRLNDTIPVTLEWRAPIARWRWECTNRETLHLGAEHAATVKIKVHKVQSNRPQNERL